MDQFKLKFIDASNIDDEHICCAIGNDKENRARAETKKAWLKARFPLGHRFLKVDVRGKVFIEYTPAEVGAARGLKVKMKKITTIAEAQALPAAWGNC